MSGESLLSIGEFSAMTHLSIRTLRRYHDGGLLVPARVDEWTGYRSYAPAQIPTALSIRRLRDLDMPIPEISRLLDERDPDRREGVLLHHLRRMEEQLERTRRSVAELRALLEPGAGRIDVERRRVDARTVAAVTGRVARAGVLDWYASAMAELDATLTDVGTTPTGPAGAIYDDALFRDDIGGLTVFLPADDPPTSRRVRPVRLAAVELAVTVHEGSHQDIDITYGRLGRWVAHHELAIADQVHETYLVGPRATADEGQWRTEIGWPVRPSS